MKKIFSAENITTFVLVILAVSVANLFVTSFLAKLFIRPAPSSTAS